MQTDLPPWSAEPGRNVSAVSRPTVDAPCAAPPGLRVCRLSLPRPAQRRPCGSRGCRGGPGRDPAQVAAPQARGAATCAPPRLGLPRGRRLAGTPGCCYCSNKEVRASGSGRSRRSSPSPRGDERRRDRGGRGELGAGVGEESAPWVARLGSSALRYPAACLGALVGLRDPGVRPGIRLEAPICPGQPLPKGDCRVSMALGKRGLWDFQGTVRRRLWLRGLEASGQGW